MVGSSIIAIILGIMTAWVVAYTNIRQKKLIQLFIFLPFIIPSYITTLAWTQFMSKIGFFAHLLSLLPGSLEPLNMYSLQGIIRVMGLSHYPLVYLLTVGGSAYLNAFRLSQCFRLLSLKRMGCRLHLKI